MSNRPPAPPRPPRLPRRLRQAAKRLDLTPQEVVLVVKLGYLLPERPTIH